MLRKISAACEVMSRMRLTHSRPAYGITSITVGDDHHSGHRRKYPHACPLARCCVSARKASPASHRCCWWRRSRATSPRCCALKPPAPCCSDDDVYITDWHNARDVSLREGAFGLDDYIEHMVRYLAAGTSAHVVAVCQPCVAALAATALMAEDDHPAQPRSLTLMAGPVDCRVNPTGVNELANSKPIEWFEKNLISHVPLPHAGHMRRVYPGFVQLSAFLSMNLERHKQQFRNLYQHLVDGDTAKADVIRVFYDEYLAVNDLPAEFYLETVQKVVSRPTTCRWASSPTAAAWSTRRPSAAPRC